MIKQSELEGLVLLALYEYFQSHSESLELAQVTSLLSIDVPEARVRMALGVLEKNGWSQSSRIMISGQVVKFWLTDKGYKYAEEITERIAAENDDDPLAAIDEQLVPASDRMVTFANNQNAEEQAVMEVEKAEEIIRSSNEIDPSLRNETLISLNAGKDLLQSEKGFAIRAFNFLIWDRLKKAIASAIEEALKVALLAVAMTLGAIIIGLL
ncbi:MAG: hypothetical protein V2I43_07420 [Parvularcula sp.]|jgi:hypothetical protein|nr:hypothetical protein [Parvularcula sp.]